MRGAPPARSWTITNRQPEHNPRITVVNDNPEFLELMDALLEDGSGYDVTTIDGDLIQNVEPIRRSRPDLLIIDLRLRGDGLAGWDVLLAVRRDADLAQLPIILCSGDLQSLDEHAQAITDDPKVATLQKPFHIEELEALVQEYVGAAQPSSL
jgi:CheY-like chemotaxis protein